MKEGRKEGGKGREGKGREGKGREEPSIIVILLWGEVLRPRGFPRKFPSLVAG